MEAEAMRKGETENAVACPSWEASRPAGVGEKEAGFEFSS